MLFVGFMHTNAIEMVYVRYIYFIDFFCAGKLSVFFCVDNVNKKYDGSLILCFVISQYKGLGSMLMRCAFGPENGVRSILESEIVSAIFVLTVGSNNFAIA